MGSEDLDDSKGDSRQHRLAKHRGKQRRFNGTGSSQRPAIELGLLLSCGVFLVYFYGFYSTVLTLPSAPDGTSRYLSLRRQLGQNFNVANPTENTVVITEVEEESNTNNNEKLPKKNAHVTDDADATIDENEIDIEITQGVWPVSISTENNSTWDKIIHPGDLTTEMYVPPFWSPPVHQNRLMSRSKAQQIGTCIEPDPVTGSYNRGDECPVHQRTIYVGIASYRDFECRSTVESIFLRAAHPERIRVGVVDQIVHDEDVKCNDPIESCSTNPHQALCLYSKQVDVYEVAAELSVGPVFARHIGYRLYRGEYYATQSDAHVTYTQNWDADIISQFSATHNDMAVLSTYLTDVQGSIDETTGQSLRDTRPIMCNTVYEGGPQGMHLRHASQPERQPSIHGLPQLSPWWAAGYSFSRGHFIVNVPYDYLQPMIFQGEEMSIGIRGFTIGYDYYAPERSVCFHHYAVGENAKLRAKVHHFWENDNKYEGTGRRAMKRLLGIVRMNPEDPITSWDHTEEDIYGIGGVRSPEKFYDLFGINVAKKTIEKHLCQFVDINGKMHKMFQPHLRSDGMGIDYSQIDFKFVDPLPNKP